MRDEYRVERHDDHAVIYLPEKVFIPNSDGFKETLELLYDEGHDTIVLDCRNLKMFDTAGISGVAVYQKKLKERGGELKIINVTHDYIKHLFSTIELHKIVEIQEV